MDKQPVIEKITTVEATRRREEITALREEYETAGQRRKREIHLRLKVIRREARIAAYGPQGALIADSPGPQDGVVYLMNAKTGAFQRVTRHKVGTKKDRRRRKAAVAKAALRAEGTQLASSSTNAAAQAPASA